MKTRNLIALVIAAGLMNPVAAIITTAENQKNTEPVMLALFAIPWFVGAYLIHRGKLTAGAVVVGLLSLVNLASAPSWKHHTAADWTSQGIAVLLAAVCLVAAVALLVRRSRGAELTGAVR